MSETAKFNIGDTVALNSGSPNLTVKRTEQRGEVHVITVTWMLDGKSQEMTAPEACFKAKASA